MKREIFILFAAAILMLKLTGCTGEADVHPILETIEVSEGDVTATTAVLKGEFTRLGNMNIREYGIELSENMIFNPSQSKGYTTPPVPGVFQVEYTGLKPNTLYYYKAYAVINTAKVYATGYETFTTLSEPK
jgi:hypothetical protein